MAAAASRLRRFIKTVALTAMLSFTVGSGLLHVQGAQQWLGAIAPAQLSAAWAESAASTQGLAGWPQALEPGGFIARGLEYFQPADTPPTLPVSGGYAQTRFAGCPQFFPSGKAPVVPAAPTLRELCFTSFAILHSGQTKTPVFVAQRLNRRSVSAARGIARTDRFYAEARLPKNERANLADYRGSGFSRGHMAPAGDMPHVDAMAQSFSLANMVPQHPIQNSGAWNRIEQDTRKYVQRARGDVYVFTGPVYGERPRVIGAGRVAVPDFVFKVVHDSVTGRSWVHWQANGPDAVAGPPISYAEFVRRTGLHLLPATGAEGGLS